MSWNFCLNGALICGGYSHQTDAIDSIRKRQVGFRCCWPTWEEWRGEYFANILLRRLRHCLRGLQFARPGPTLLDEQDKQTEEPMTAQRFGAGIWHFATYLDRYA